MQVGVRLTDIDYIVELTCLPCVNGYLAEGYVLISTHRGYAKHATWAEGREYHEPQTVYCLGWPLGSGDHPHPRCGVDMSGEGRNECRYDELKRIELGMTHST
jgi:hypothetical protein